MVRQIDVAVVRGKADEVVLFEVLWQPDEATSMLPTVGLGRPASRTKRVRLIFKGQEVMVGEGVIGLGRVAQPGASSAVHYTVED